LTRSLLTVIPLHSTNEVRCMTA